MEATLIYLKQNEKRRLMIRETKRFIQDLSFKDIAIKDRCRIIWEEIASPTTSWVTIEGPGFIKVLREGEQ